MAYLLKTTTFSILFLLSAFTGWAQHSRGPSTPEERDKAVRAVRLLETDPFNKDAGSLRAWLTIWLGEVPDIKNPPCAEYLGPIAGSGEDYATEIFFQMMFSGAAFIIENPAKSNDPAAVNLAGVEGALKAYEAILKAKPTAKFAYLDDLIAKRQKGELKAYVQEIAETKCKGIK